MDQIFIPFICLFDKTLKYCFIKLFDYLLDGFIFDGSNNCLFDRFDDQIDLNCLFDDTFICLRFLKILRTQIAY